MFTINISIVHFLHVRSDRSCSCYLVISTNNVLWLHFCNFVLDITLNKFALNYIHRRRCQRIVKVEFFYENTCHYMTARIFWRYFRMSQGTLNEVIRFLENSDHLQQREQYIRVPVDKKIAMTCCYLGSSVPTMQ